MSITTSATGDITVLRIDGDLAGANAEEFRAVAKECMQQGRRDFIVDFAGAQSCDSKGLESLTWLQRECEDRLGLVRLCSLNETIKKILEVTRLDQAFEDHDDTF